jgi:uncharacterized protein DUF4240
VRAAPMDEHRFWQLIDESRRRAARDPHRQMTRLRELLAVLTPEEVLEFGTILWRLHGVAYRAELWGAAQLIAGHGDDEVFDNFRAWLIAQGREAYEAALSNPDSLAAIAEADETELEDLFSVAPDVYAQLTGADDFYKHVPLSPRMDIPEGATRLWADERGRLDPDKARRVYPRLFAKFGHGSA